MRAPQVKIAQTVIDHSRDATAKKRGGLNFADFVDLTNGNDQSHAHRAQIPVPSAHRAPLTPPLRCACATGYDVVPRGHDEGEGMGGVQALDSYIGA